MEDTYDDSDDSVTVGNLFTWRCTACGWWCTHREPSSCPVCKCARPGRPAAVVQDLVSWLRGAVDAFEGRPAMRVPMQAWAALQDLGYSAGRVEGAAWREQGLDLAEQLRRQQCGRVWRVQGAGVDALVVGAGGKLDALRQATGSRLVSARLTGEGDYVVDLLGETGRPETGRAAVCELTREGEA